ncbi:hypothetical protein FJW08_31730 [Mesorhizobium sp. B3-2-1]|nr:hypothetical protein FJW08_31730 [Mesorhizobium sp. B3-2-1]
MSDSYHFTTLACELLHKGYVSFSPWSICHECLDESKILIQATKEKHASWLVDKTGITLSQARELIDLLGLGSLPSLVREALLLAKR